MQIFFSFRKFKLYDDFNKGKVPANDENEADNAREVAKAADKSKICIIS